MLGNNECDGPFCGGYAVMDFPSIRFLCAEHGAGLGVLDDVRWIDNTRRRWSGCGHLFMLGRPD